MDSDIDMLVEILTRLPLKSFSRSRCVCKSWCRLLSDDYVRSKLPMVVSAVFQESGSGIKNGGPTYFSTANNAGFEPADLSSLPFYSNSTLVDCCNGLLLFHSSLTSLFHVCNPITRECTALPKPPPSKKTQLSVLAFDPHHRRRFNVVNFVGWLPQGAHLELFDSESYTWVEHHVHWGVDTAELSATMRCIDGVLYILTRRHRQMVAVNLDSLSCNLIELPEATGIDCWIGKLGGKLHYGASHEGNKLRVWVLKREEVWVLKHCVSIEMGKFRVLGFNPEKDVVYMWVGTTLVAFDLCHERVEEVWELGKEKGHLVDVWVFPFTKYLEDALPRRNYVV